jgi:hypothetical protein
MDKENLSRVGKLWRIESKIYNSCQAVALFGDSLNKYKLVCKIKKQLEEQKRGLLKSDIPYGEMADFIIENIDHMKYDTLLKEITHIALKI